MVWRAAVLGEARMVCFEGRGAGVRRSGSFFCFLRGAPCPGLGGPAVVPFAAAGFWDPLFWV